MARLLLLLVLCVLGHGWVADAVDVHPVGETTTASRRLQQFRAEPKFPFTRCKSYVSSGQPYYLANATYSVDDTGLAEYSFTIRYKGPQVNASDCYKKLTDSLHKVAFLAYAECIPAIQVAGKKASVNGKSKSLLIYEYPTGASIVISALGLNATTADGAVITLNAVAPCDRPGYLFRPNADKGVALEYVFSESGAHQCCGLNY